MNDDRQLDDTFTALAHPARRRMLVLLAERDRRVTEVAAEFDCSLNVVSKHIRVLEHAGLIRREQSGRVHQIHFDAKPLHAAAVFIERSRAQWNGKLDRLGGYLDRMAAQEARGDAHKSSAKKTRK